MAKIIIITLFLAMLLPPLMVDGAIKKNSIGTSLTRMKMNLEVRNREVQKVRKEIYQIEKNISSGNNRLNLFSKSLSQIDLKIYKLIEELKKDTKKLKTSQKKSKKLFKLTVLQMLSGEESEADLAAKTLLLRGLKLKISDLKKIQFSLKQRNNTIAEMKKKFRQIQADREELLSILNSMELNKVTLVNRYVSVSKTADYYKMNIEKLKAKRKISKKISKRAKKNSFKKYGLAFRPPLGKFIKLDHGKKGLSYHFKESSPLVAPESGKVVYQGRLANYGKVLMIEHGNQIKSIILGDFLSKVKKGILVKKGDILGYSKAIAKNEGTIYFEVREKNKVKNTIFLLDKKYLTQNDLKKI